MSESKMCRMFSNVWSTLKIEITRERLNSRTAMNELRMNLMRDMNIAKLKKLWMMTKLILIPFKTNFSRRIYRYSGTLSSANKSTEKLKLKS
jgi:hypothetical protein